MIRIKNEDVVDNLDGVLRKLEIALSHYPLPEGEGDENIAGF